MRDLAGQRFGQLTVRSSAKSVKGSAMWNCDCDCGRATTVRASSLTSGRTRSCGCLQRARARELIRLNQRGYRPLPLLPYGVTPLNWIPPERLIEQCGR